MTYAELVATAKDLMAIESCLHGSGTGRKDWDIAQWVEYLKQD